MKPEPLEACGVMREYRLTLLVFPESTTGAPVLCDRRALRMVMSILQPRRAALSSESSPQRVRPMADFRG
jgi:hypothetical protein